MHIEKLDDENKKGKTLIVFGESGVGKTSLLGTLPENETLILDVEGGTVVLRGKKMGVVRIKEDLSNLKEVFDEIVNTNVIDFKYIALDSATELEKFMQVRLSQKSSNDGMPSLHDYGVVSFKMRDYMRRLRDLRDKGITVIVTALEFPLELVNNENETRTRTYPMMAQKLAPEIAGLFDIVAHMEVSSKAGHEGERFLRLDGTDSVLAKNRYGHARFATADLTKLFADIDAHIAPKPEPKPEVPAKGESKPKKGGEL